MNDMRIGVIGSGGRGGLAVHAHLPGNGSRVVACCDVSQSVLDQNRAQYGTDIHTSLDYRELLEQDLDAVFVTSPDFLHEEHALAAIEAVGAVYLEKPMTITIDGCDRVLAAAFDRIVASVRAHVPEADIKGVNVQQMAGAGREVILGLKRDPVFGPVVMVGLGGTFVEVFKDVAFRAVPMETHDVSDMIRGLRSFPLLDGARGRAKCDIAAVEDCIVRLAQLGVDCPEIQELDMNPVIVKEARQGAVVADARIMI